MAQARPTQRSGGSELELILREEILYFLDIFRSAGVENGEYILRPGHGEIEERALI